MKATSSLENLPVEMPYNRLRTALMLYGKPWAQLDAEELRRVRAQADKEYQIEQRILQSAEAVGVMVGDAEVARALAEIRAKYPDAESFHASLEDSQLDEPSLRLALARQCKVNTILDKVDAATPVEIDEVEIGIYYHAHFDSFQQPERRDTYHILISVNEDFPENSRPRALERLRAIADKLEHKPHLFEELAGRHSECPTAMRGGRIGKVRRGQLFPSLDAALFRLRAGQLSAIIESEMGFHILLCKAIDAPQTLSLKKATPHIRKILAERVRESRRRQWIAALPTTP
ncbi:MAG: nitrogen fixation protein NifM [Candidatus Methylumidiphilus sp.]